MPSDFVHGKAIDVRAARQQELNRPLLLRCITRSDHFITSAPGLRRIDSVERSRN